MTLEAQAAVVTAGMSRPRRLLVCAHRWVGLAIACFIAVAGVTGALLAFYEELDGALNPDLFEVAPPREGDVAMHPVTVRDRLAATLPAGSVVDTVPLGSASDPSPERALVFTVTGHPSGHDEWFVDPYTGHVKGSRAWGVLGGGRRGVMPFVYRLHYSLALDNVGALLLGLVALLWTVDCFVGFALTMPPRRHMPGRSPRSPRMWLRRWRASWIVHAGKRFTAIFTWHRASGLWIWGLLLVFAWSSVGLNLTQVYKPTMSLVFSFGDDPRLRLPVLEPPRTAPRLDWSAAHRRAREVAAATATDEGFQVLGESSLSYDAGSGLYQYRFHTTLDVSSSRHANTRVWIDGDTGTLFGVLRPTGSSGDTVTSWLWGIHWGSVEGGGWPLRIAVAATGLGASLLSLTGIWIWVARRRRRRLATTDARAR